MESKSVHITVWYVMLTVLTVLGTAMFVLFFNLNNKMDELRANSEQLELKVSKLSEINTEDIDNDNTTYILKNHNGVIGVFDISGVLTDIIDVDIKSLPEQDRTLLEAGIWARSRQELASLIEDYTG